MLNNNISKHILPTSSNLLGICFVILNFVKLWKVGRVETLIIDKVIVVAMLFFLAASLLSYSSMRSVHKAGAYERIADTIFLAGLVLLTLIALVMAFQLI